MDNLNSKILLVDSSFDANSLKNRKSTYNKIISFDYDSHHILLNSKIQHEISDNYLNRNELDQIQKLSYELSKWYKQKEISLFVEYDEISLGNLTYIEFMDYIVGFLKKFYELTKITDKYPLSEFFTAPQLYSITKQLTNNVHKLQQEKSNPSELIKYSYRFGGKSISINISKKNYLMLKSISETILQKIMKFDKTKNQNKHILLIEFDPIKYKKLLFTANELSQNILLYNRRRPTIWNKESFGTIKESNCKIATFKSLLDNELLIRIDDAKKKINENLESLFSKEQFFESFFSLNSKSFWLAFKPFFLDLIKNRFNEAVQEIEIGKKLFEKYNISSALILSEIGFNEQIMMNLARKNNVSIVIIQHGMPYETQEAYERNNLLGFFPNFSDKIIVWGKSTQKYVEKSGISLTKIAQLGTPLYDELFLNQHLHATKKQKTILLATSPPMKDFVYDLTIETNEKYQQAIERICQIISKTNNKLVIKLHPSLVDFNIEELTKKIDPKISIFKTGDIFSLVRECDVLITFDLSTTILEAQILQKPAISISLKDYGFGKSEIFESKSCIQTTIENFETELDKVLTDKNYQKQLIENGKRFVDYYLTNKGNSSEHILDFLKNVSH